MKIKFRVYPVENPKGSTVAYASMEIEESFVCTGIRIVDGKKGLFVSMPQTKNKDGDFQDIFFPITAKAHEYVKSKVLEKYKDTGEYKRFKDKKEKAKEKKKGNSAEFEDADNYEESGKENGDEFMNVGEQEKLPFN